MWQPIAESQEGQANISEQVVDREVEGVKIAEGGATNEKKETGSKEKEEEEEEKKQRVRSM